MFRIDKNVTYKLVNGSTIVAYDGDGQPLIGHSSIPRGRQSSWPDRVASYPIPHPGKEALNWNKLFNRSYETIKEMRNASCQKKKSTQWIEIHTRLPMKTETLKPKKN